MTDNLSALVMYFCLCSILSVTYGNHCDRPEAIPTRPKLRFFATHTHCSYCMQSAIVRGTVSSMTTWNKVGNINRSQHDCSTSSDLQPTPTSTVLPPTPSRKALVQVPIHLASIWLLKVKAKENLCIATHAIVCALFQEYGTQGSCKIFMA